MKSSMHTTRDPEKLASAAVTMRSCVPDAKAGGEGYPVSRDHGAPSAHEGTHPPILTCGGDRWRTSSFANGLRPRCCTRGGKRRTAPVRSATRRGSGCRPASPRAQRRRGSCPSPRPSGCAQQRRRSARHGCQQQQQQQLPPHQLRLVLRAWVPWESRGTARTPPSLSLATATRLQRYYLVVLQRSGPLGRLPRRGAPGARRRRGA